MAWLEGFGMLSHSLWSPVSQYGRYTGKSAIAHLHCITRDPHLGCDVIPDILCEELRSQRAEIAF